MNSYEMDWEADSMTYAQSAPRENAVEHIVRVIKEAILSIAIAGVAGMIVGILATQGIAYALTYAAPGWQTDVIAMVAGLVVGYAAAATVTIWELVVGLTETLRAMGGDLERTVERVINNLEGRGTSQTHQSDTGSYVATVDGSVAYPRASSTQYTPKQYAQGTAASAPLSSTAYTTPTAITSSTVYPAYPTYTPSTTPADSGYVASPAASTNSQPQQATSGTAATALAAPLVPVDQSR